MEIVLIEAVNSGLHQWFWILVVIVLLVLFTISCTWGDNQ